MKRALIFVLLAIVAVAGLWSLRPTARVAAPVEEAGGSCEQESACSTVIDQSARNGTGDRSEPPAAPEPAVPAPAAPPAPLPAPAPAAQAREDLRDEADRLLAEGKVIEGIDAMRKATDADPSARNHGDLGALLERLTAFDEAARNLRRAAELDPMNADRWIALANAYYRAVNPGEAWKAEARAREVEPGLALAWDGRGRRIRQGDSAGDNP